MSVKKKRSDKCAVFTIGQVAERLQVSNQHIINLIDCGQLNAINIGTGAARVWRIPISEVAQYEARKSSLTAGGGK